MTTPLDTITGLLQRLTPDQLQTIENYVAYFYRQNLANSIATLPAATLVGLGTVIEIFTNPRPPIIIPPPPAQNIVLPPPPLVENAVPQPLLPDLPPSPLVIAEGDLGPAPTTIAPRHYTIAPLHLSATTTYQHQHPQLQPLDFTCRGCLEGDELSAWTHTWTEGCEGAQGVQEEDQYEEEDYDEYEEDRRYVTRDDEA
jgi:hypothetical protein